MRHSAALSKETSPVATTTKPIIIDGNFSDWDSSELITTPANVVPGYSLYGTVQNDTYFIAVQATATTDPVIGAGTTIWLNTDQNTATGYSPYTTSSIGADYNITTIDGSFYLYTGAAAENFVTGPLTTARDPGGPNGPGRQHAHLAADVQQLEQDSHIAHLYHG